ncbi:Ribonuclease H-like superfamily [Arabidopsis suecica]|uniref:Ribonuclease H-like superfamily n=1 Tax=Arabidopsis suecica TaxID=45249 RepID=A0A8T1Y0C1_ARASU|nr:Ribonuclease H-like superfamily [Arabidopsis suecica]
MKMDETIDDYFGRVMKVSNKMRSNGEEMPDSKIVEKILRTLTEKFTYVVVSIEESKDTGNMSIDELQSSLSVHEQKFKKTPLEEEMQALNVNAQGRGRGSFRGRGRGRGGREIDEKEEVLLMAYVELHGAQRSDAWFVDSGCSNHMCGDKGIFSELDTNFTHHVKLGNNHKLNVAGKGVVKLVLKGVSYAISDVYYVPELRNNLLSVGQLQEKGLDVLFKGGEKKTCSIFHPTKGKIAESIMSANRMYVLIAETCGNEEEKCLQIDVSDKTELWHHRYGHLSYKGLLTLHNKEMVVGLPEIQQVKATCEAYVKGKQHRVPFPKQSAWRATEKLQLIHSDLCGPITPSSNSQKRYLISFIDDFSRKTWIYFALEKSEALHHFKLFKAFVEKQTGMFIKCLRTDRGGEYNSGEFKEFCDKNGIKRQLTTAYTPQQNGVAERKNRTIMNMVRTVLREKEIPRSFWPEAVQWANHVLNRSPTVAVKDKTPEEAWSDKKPSVEHFKILGCVGHVHVSDVKRTKLDDKSVKCVLLGYSSESKAFKMYDPMEKRIHISRDVIFEEEKKWAWKKNHSAEQNMELEWENKQNEEINEEGDENDAEGEENDAEDENVEVDAQPQPQFGETRVRRPPIWAADYTSGEELSDAEEEINMAKIDVLNVDFLAFMIISDPTTFEEAVKDQKWREAMNAEMNSIEKNQTWSLVSLPDGAKANGVKWIYKTKFNELGEVDKFKARLVVKGYAQEYGVDYTEVFAPVARMDTVRMILAVAAHRGWGIYQLDVKSAFLHGELEEDVYVEQPQGYEVSEKKEMVYKLHKALYGLKQVPRAWFSRIESYFIKEGFTSSPNEHTLFIKRIGGNILIVSVYVDDLLFTGNSAELLEEFKRSMKREFDMTDLGKMRYFLGIEVIQKPEEGIFICQRKYAAEVIERFGMQHHNPVCNPIVPGQKIGRDVAGEKIDATLYKQMVGSLMYLTATRPDLMFVVCLISRFMASPTQLHLAVAKRVLRYLKGTLDCGVWYKRGAMSDLVAYTDSDYAGDIDDSKSTSGYVFMMSGGAVSWSSRKQPIVTLSTTEAEYVAAVACACQAIWMRRILKEISHVQAEEMVVLCDNTSTIKLSKNAVMHGRSKHIRVRYHFLRDLTKQGIITLAYCNTEMQLADMMTKPLKLVSFQKARAAFGMITLSELNLSET